MRPLWQGSYEKVTDENLDAESPERQPRPGRQDCNNGKRTGLERAIVIYMVASSIGLALLLALSLYRISRTDLLPATKKINGQRVCGNSAAEAISLGCTFDQMTWSWLSPSCPRYASSEFLSADDWKYYVDPYNRVLASSNNWTMAIDNQVPLYTERREHISHCLYTFLSLAQVIRDGTPTHPRLSSYGHIKHCVEVVTESVKRDKDWYTVDADMGAVSFDEGC